jgi:hypothetical protein
LDCPWDGNRSKTVLLVLVLVLDVSKVFEDEDENDDEGEPSTAAFHTDSEGRAPQTRAP